MSVKINKMLIYILLLVFVGVNSEYTGIPANYSNVCSDQNHIFLVPGVLSAGTSNRVCISRFFTEGPAKLNVRLIGEDKNITTAARDFGAVDGGCVDLMVPALPNTKADIIVSLRYPHHKCEWSKRATLRIASGGILVIHTEKARYRPGELVRARLFQLRPDLTPVQGAIDEIWLECAHSWEGARIAQWSRVRTKLGVAQIQHQLDEFAAEGKWTIRARLSDGTRGAAAFQVGHYELPPFQLTVKHADKVLRTSERLVWTVCVRYPWTEAVEGMLVIRIRGVGSPNESSQGIRTAVRLRAPKACHRHAAAAKRIGLNRVNGTDVVVADFSFQEDGTRIWQNTTVVSQVVDKPITLEYLTKHRAVISPGLPYNLKIKATRIDGKPSPNERIKMCRSPTNDKGDERSSIEYCDEGVTDTGGVARVTFKADGDGHFYKFLAYLKNDNTTTTTPLILPVNSKGSLHAALGPLKVDTLNVRTLVPLYLNAKSITSAITAHFVVITRGGIIYRWGATTQCPIRNSADPVQTTSRNSPCYAHDYGPNYLSNNQTLPDDQRKSKRSDQEFRSKRAIRNDDATKKSDNKDIDTQMLRIMLPLKVTHQMCPESHLIVYFYYKGEFVSASKRFELDECFENKVITSWLPRQVPPSSLSTLRLSPPSPALCALSVSLTPPASVQQLIMETLSRMMYVKHNLTVYDGMGDCFLTEDTPSIPSTSLALTSTWLASGGIRLIGSEVERKPNCAPPEMMMTDDVSVPRTDFSEAWLWRLVAVGSNGSVDVVAKVPDSITRYEATAVCLYKTGIAISQPAVLQVFQDFFIHIDGAKRLRRGDTSIVKYRLFNYLYEPLSVQIQILTDPHLEGPSDYVEMACIGARSSIARRIEISAKLVGTGRVSVHAKSVKDGNCVNATMSSSNVSDEVIIEINVEPEGILVQDQKSMMLCARGSPESNNYEVTWTWPSVPSVPDTETLMIWASGDITGPLLADADDLILLPRGCGEQNLARMATNLLAYTELDPQAPAYLTAKEHILRGYTRQLQYVHPLGGFSAFGSSEATPSTWLTAFAVRYMKKAHQILYPDQPLHPAIQKAEQWLFDQQMENGCFRNEGQVFHRELKGGLNEDGELSSIGLTAYVITSLIDTSPIPSRIIKNTLHCLRALPPMKRKNPARVYVMSLLGYAFMKLRHYEDELVKVNEAGAINTSRVRKRASDLEKDENMRQLLDLLKVAKRSDGYVWWETGSLSTSIEATSYSLLALSYCGCSERESSGDAHSAIQWLNTHRNPTGGFVTTQDTLIALEALTAWYHKQPGTPANLTAVIQGTSKKTVRLWTGMRVPEVVNMGTDRKVHVQVEGSGCAIFQATRSYHSLNPEQRGNALTVQVTVDTEGNVDCDSNGHNCFCAAVVEACVLWTRGFPEMALLEVALPGGYEADPSLLYEQLQKNDRLLRRIELTPTNSRAILYLASKDNTLGRTGHQCYKIHSLGPKSKTKPAYAKVMDYYKPTVNDTQMYTIPEECPPKIQPVNEEYSRTDNLFIEPKSLDNEDVSNSNISPEDIPDGIPFEDSLYDNLKDNKTKGEENHNKVNGTENTNDKHDDSEKSSEIIDRSGNNDNVVRNITKIHDKIELLDEMKDPNAIHKPTNRQSNEIAIVGNVKDLPVEEDGTNNNYTEISRKGIDIKFGNDKNNKIETLKQKESKNSLNTSEGITKFQNDENNKTQPSKQNDLFGKGSNDKQNTPKIGKGLNEKDENGQPDTSDQNDLGSNESTDIQNLLNTSENYTDDINAIVTTRRSFDYPPTISEMDSAKEEMTPPNIIAKKDKQPKSLNFGESNNKPNLFTQKIIQASQEKHVTNHTSSSIIKPLKEVNETKSPNINRTGKTLSYSDVFGVQPNYYFTNNYRNAYQNKAIDYTPNLRNEYRRDNTEINNRHKMERTDIEPITKKSESYQVNETGDVNNNEERNITTVLNPIVDDSKRNEAIKTDTTTTPQEYLVDRTGATQGYYVDNPNLSDFHVIDTDKDLAVPSGVEGPIPSVMLPPPQLGLMNGRKHAYPGRRDTPEAGFYQSQPQYPSYPNYWPQQSQQPRMYPSYMEYSQDYWRNYWRYYGNQR